MSDDTKPQGDPAVSEELKGVPEELLDNATISLGGELESLRLVVGGWRTCGSTSIV